MKNMYSPYQQNKRGLIGKVYNKVDVMVINEKITKLLNLEVDFSNTKREQKIHDMLTLQRDNREFIIRQLNQQMLERGQYNVY